MYHQAAEANSFPTLQEFEKQQVKKEQARRKQQSIEKVRVEQSPMDLEANRKDMA